MRHNRCFDCLNSGKGEPAENKGWYHPCTLGIQNEGLQDVESCEKFSMNAGFQMGGYYTHMHFEGEPEQKGENRSACLDWVIHGDGEFPRDEPDKWMYFHLCDFTQLERWVKAWGVELRKRGLVVDE